MTGESNCPHCDGCGEVTIILPNGGIDAASCSRCDGTGETVFEDYVTEKSNAQIPLLDKGVEKVKLISKKIKLSETQEDLLRTFLVREYDSYCLDCDVKNYSPNTYRCKSEIRTTNSLIKKGLVGELNKRDSFEKNYYKCELTNTGREYAMGMLFDYAEYLYEIAMEKEQFESIRYDEEKRIRDYILSNHSLTSDELDVDVFLYIEKDDSHEFSYRISLRRDTGETYSNDNKIIYTLFEIVKPYREHSDGYQVYGRGSVPIANINIYDKMLVVVHEIINSGLLIGG